KRHALLALDAEFLESIAGAIYSLEKLLIADAFITAFNRNAFSPPFAGMVVNEMGGNVELRRQGNLRHGADQAAPVCVELLRSSFSRALKNFPDRSLAVLSIRRWPTLASMPPTWTLPV